MQLFTEVHTNMPLNRDALKKKRKSLTKLNYLNQQRDTEFWILNSMVNLSKELTLYESYLHRFWTSLPNDILGQSDQKTLENKNNYYLFFLIATGAVEGCPVKYESIHCFWHHVIMTNSNLL